MNSHTILIVEDDVHINQIVTDALNKQGMQCTQAYSGTEARLHIQHQKFDLIILDLMLPGLSGEDFIKALRTDMDKSTPVIILSSKDKLDHKLELFRYGADDYMTKPFEVEELLARVHVQLKRSSENEQTRTLKHNGLVIDIDNFSASINGEPLALTRKEFKILELLIKHPTRIFTKRDLYELAWEEIYIGEDKTITVHVSNLRQKIKAHTDEPYIDTVWGIGFRLSK